MASGLVAVIGIFVASIVSCDIAMASSRSAVAKCPTQFSNLFRQKILVPIRGNPLMTYSINVTDQHGQTAARAVRFMPVSSWGLPRGLVGRTYSLEIAVADAAEARNLFEQILQNGPAEWQGYVLPPANGATTFYEIFGDVIEGGALPAVRNHVVATEVPVVFTLHFGKSADALRAVTEMTRTLQKMGLKPAPDFYQHINLDTLANRFAWLHGGFAKWTSSLTTDESRALSSLGLGDYQFVQMALRDGSFQNSNSFGKLIEAADRGISKSKLERPITVYRVDSSDHIAQLWKNLSAGTAKPGHAMPRDPGYTFTSLDKAVANWWNFSQLDEKGIRIEIDLPKGAHAASIDALHSHSNRGYQELILPRDSDFRVLSFGTDSTGQRFVRVRADLK